MIHQSNMEATLYRTEVCNLPLPQAQPLPKHKPPSLCFVGLSSPRVKGLRCWLRQQGSGIRCESQGSAMESHKEMESGVMMGGSEGQEMGIWRDKCPETASAELMERLEREAIMGEDQGRQPIDYNRRAEIFSESARVFQALKESNTPSPPNS